MTWGAAPDVEQDRAREEPYEPARNGSSAWLKRAGIRHCRRAPGSPYRHSVEVGSY
jgi:hypothetical protein